MVAIVEATHTSIPALGSSMSAVSVCHGKSKEKVEDAWQQVTAYIVQLEKRLKEMELHTQGHDDHI